MKKTIITILVVAAFALCVAMISAGDIPSGCPSNLCSESYTTETNTTLFNYMQACILQGGDAGWCAFEAQLWGIDNGYIYPPNLSPIFSDAYYALHSAGFSYWAAYIYCLNPYDANVPPAAQVVIAQAMVSSYISMSCQLVCQLYQNGHGDLVTYELISACVGNLNTYQQEQYNYCMYAIGNPGQCFQSLF